MNRKIIIGVCVVAIITAGSLLFKPGTNKSDDATIIGNQLETVSNTNILKEYENSDAGFSFKYPANYGDVVMRKYSGDSGYGYQGAVGIPGQYYFFFDYKTKNFIIGDSSPDDIIDDPCKSNEVSCESIQLKNGSIIQLIKKNDVRIQEPFSFEISLSKANYESVIFISSDRSTLINIASQLEIFN